MGVVVRTGPLAVLGAAAALMAAGCGGGGGGGNETSGTTTSSSAGSNTTVALVSDIGKFNDRSFNQSQKEGLDRAKTDLGVNTIALQSNSPSDYVPNLTQAVRKKANLIISAGFLLASDTNTVAKIAASDMTPPPQLASRRDLRLDTPFAVTSRSGHRRSST